VCCPILGGRGYSCQFRLGVNCKISHTVSANAKKGTLSKDQTGFTIPNRGKMDMPFGD